MPDSATFAATAIGIGAPMPAGSRGSSRTSRVPIAGSTACTVAGTDALTPSTVAVMLVVPTALPTTTPSASTVATSVFALDQRTSRSVSGVSAESRATACSRAVSPTGTVTPLCQKRTRATFAAAVPVTSTTALPLFPSLVAVIVAWPARRACTTPWAETLATSVSPLAQATARPSRMPPPASVGVARSATDSPTRSRGVAGATVTRATAGDRTPAPPSEHAIAHGAVDASAMARRPAGVDILPRIVASIRRIRERKLPIEDERRMNAEPVHTSGGYLDRRSGVAWRSHSASLPRHG